MKALIIGCGYVGLELGRQLREAGHEVWGMRRSEDGAQEMEAAGIRPIVGDVSEDGLARVDGNFDWVANAVSSSKGGAEDYRRVYLEGNRKLVVWARERGVKKLVYTSSTSVYGQMDGSAVKESSPAEPAGETAKILVEAEKVLLEAAPTVPAVVLRVAGIYGPGRGHLFKQFLKNEATIPGKGERIINMIHRDDVARAVIAAFKNGRAGEIYNVVDDEPVAMVHFFRWLAETLGKWMPPFGPEESEGERKRAITNKKVQNRRMKVELGVVLKFPTYRQGYTAEIRRLEEAGELNLDPEPR
jgi:nucleoside-diphosphate-sugar epimerase